MLRRFKEWVPKYVTVAVLWLAWAYAMQGLYALVRPDPFDMGAFVAGCALVLACKGTYGEWK